MDQARISLWKQILISQYYLDKVYQVLMSQSFQHSYLSQSYFLHIRVVFSFKKLLYRDNLKHYIQSFSLFFKRIEPFATNTIFLNPLTLQPDSLNISYLDYFIYSHSIPLIKTKPPKVNEVGVLN